MSLTQPLSPKAPYTLNPKQCRRQSIRLARLDDDPFTATGSMAAGPTAPTAAWRDAGVGLFLGLVLQGYSAGFSVLETPVALRDSVQDALREIRR